jgi:hypothetical protein
LLQHLLSAWGFARSLRETPLQRFHSIINGPIAATARPPRRMKMGLRMGMDRNRNGGETPNINLIRPTLTHL